MTALARKDVSIVADIVVSAIEAGQEPGVAIALSGPKGDYSQAFGSCPQKERDLPDIIVMASWDAGLGAIMQLHGMAIPEEAVASLLIDDLRSSERPLA